MEYTKLGNTDIEISKLCVGCMSFGKPSADLHEWTLNPQDTENVVDVKLTAEDIAYLEELYVPHKVVGAL